MPTVLFICSGNYYRSRFAEILFNWLAPPRGLDWRADSRGLWPDAANLGLISPHAVAGLRERGVPIPDRIRSPLTADARDLQSSDLVVALKEAEHRPMMLESFPSWADQITYWHIHDLDCAEPAEALAELEMQTKGLIEQLLLKSAYSALGVPSFRSG
jgi:protein-tyrosine phosphatase